MTPLGRRYDVAFFLDTPRTIHCFQVEVTPNPELEAQRLRKRPLRVESLLDNVATVAGEEVTLRFQLLDPVTDEPVTHRDDVRVVAFRCPGLEQQRLTATHLGGGIYEARYKPTQPGRYQAYVSCASAGLSANRARPLIFDVDAAQTL